MAEQYLNLSGLQAFYDKLKTTAFIDSALSADSPKPVANSAITTILTGIQTDIDNLSSVSGLTALKAYKTITVNTTSVNANNSASTITITGGGNIAFTADNTNRKITISAKDTNKIADMTDVSNYFDGTSAIYAKSATSATNAYNLTNTAIKVASATSATKAESASASDKLKTARTISAGGDISWSVSFNGSQNATANATIVSVPSSAISSVAWSAISSHAGAVDTSTTNKFTTPKAVNDAITAAMNQKASFKGPYATLGDIPTTALDKLSIYLIGPTGSGDDKYKEYVLTGTTTAQMLQIGDTSTDLSDYLKTTVFTSWSGSTSSVFSGKSKSADNATKAGDSDKLGGTGATTIINSAKSGAAASAWISANSGIAGIKNYSTITFTTGSTTRGTFTPTTSSDTFTFKAGSNIDFTSSGANTITISAKDTTYGTSNFITANKQVTAVNGSTNTGFDLSALKLSAGTNIQLVSAGVGVIGISAKDTTYTVGNGTIKIQSGTTPATGSFTVNQTGNSTIYLGGMAFQQTSSFMATGSMIPYTSAEVTGGIIW